MCSCVRVFVCLCVSELANISKCNKSRYDTHEIVSEIIGTQTRTHTRIAGAPVAWNDD